MGVGEGGWIMGDGEGRGQVSGVGGEEVGDLVLREPK